MEIFDIHFLRPVFLYIGVFFLFLSLFFIYIKNRKESINIYFYDDLKKIYKYQNIYFYIKSILILFIIFIYFILFANPNNINATEKIKKDSIDIVFVLDVSKSMDASDLEPNRMQVAKDMISDFLNKIKYDRIGLVIFAGKPFISIPLTFDYDILKETISNIKTDSLNQTLELLNGTSTGDALLLAKGLFNNKGKTREKIIVLITDGDANKGLNPLVSANILKQENIKIYAIGVGTEKGGFIEIGNGIFVQKMQVAPLNDKSILELTQITSGEYYKANDKEAFKQIFDKLQTLNKSEIEVEINKIFVQKYDIFVYILITLLFVLLSIEYFLIKK